MDMTASEAVKPSSHDGGHVGACESQCSQPSWLISCLSEVHPLRRQHDHMHLGLC